MSDQPIVLRNFSGVPEITKDAYHLRGEALNAARAVGRVENDQQQAIAVEALRLLKELRSGMEASRKAIKAPVLSLGRKIDDIAANFLEDAGKQEGRLQGMINHYQRKQLEQRREQQLELANEAKHAAELEIKSGELRHQAVFETDPSKKAEMLREADELDVKAIDAKMTGELAVIDDPSKPKGLVVRNRINFQVEEWSGAVLFLEAYPKFWKWNKETETLKLDRQGVLDELNRPNSDGLFHKTKFPEELSANEDRRLVRPPGLHVYEETKAHVR
jgi:hypothetical protein